MCQIPKCKSQIQITFRPNQFQLEGAGFKNTMKKFFRVSQTAWNNFFRPAVNVAAPFVIMIVGAKSKNSQVGAATTNILKSISEGKILSLIDLHGRVLRLKVM